MRDQGVSFVAAAWTKFVGRALCAAQLDHSSGSLADDCMIHQKHICSVYCRQGAAVFGPDHLVMPIYRLS